MSVAQNVLKLHSGLPAGVTLVAVSKTHPVEVVREAYDAGQRVFGENRPQEMSAKHAELPDDIQWHMIGHLQTNKVRMIAPFVSLIQSADSARLLREISRQAVLNGRVIDVLLEIRIAREESKEGWEWEELVEWLEQGEWRGLAGVRFRGVMGVATFTDDEAVVRAEFETLAGYHAELRTRFFGTDVGANEGTGDFDRGASEGAGGRDGSNADGNGKTGGLKTEDNGHGHDDGHGGFDTISMGMSSDYPLAVSCGSTMVRIGSLIFGERDYRKQ